MPTCLPRASSVSRVAPVQAPATPPILAKLVAAHKIFVDRKNRERDFIAWLETEAAAVDRRAQRKRVFTEWAVNQAALVDKRHYILGVLASDPTKDLN